MRPIRLIPPARAAGLLAGAAMLLGACSATGATAAPSSAPSASAPAAVSAAPSASAAGATEVKVAQDAKLGAILTDENGRTLYVFKKDSAGTSACSGQCAVNWPPLTVPGGEAVTAGAGVTGTFATLKRADGSTQVTYDGAPLYYFKGDQKAGDTNGQGISGVWFAETPTGATAAAAASPSPSAAAGGDRGYGGYGGGSSPAPSAGSATTASIVDFGFQPGSVTIKAGEAVTWTNTGSASHTITADDSSFDSGTVASGGTFRHVFATAGTFSYHCAIHPSMTGKVVVTS